MRRRVVELVCVGCTILMHVSTPLHFQYFRMEACARPQSRLGLQLPVELFHYSLSCSIKGRQILCYSFKVTAIWLSNLFADKRENIIGYSCCQEVICNGHRQLCVTTRSCSYYIYHILSNVGTTIILHAVIGLLGCFQRRCYRECSRAHLNTDGCICRSPPSLSASTQATTLFSRQSTLEDLDGMPECIPKTSERARPKLRKMYSMDMSNSSVDSGSSIVSRCPASAPRLLHSHRHEHSDCTLSSFMTNTDLLCSFFVSLFCLFVDYVPQTVQRSLRELLFVIQHPTGNIVVACVQNGCWRIGRG